MTALQEAYNDFMLSRQVMRCTPKTMEHYRFTAGGFVGWLHRQGMDAPGQIHARHVRAYLIHHAEHGVKDTTLHAHARAVKTLLRFLHTEGYMAALVKFQMPRLDHKAMPVLSSAELRRVLDTCKNLRDKALVTFFADSGLRLAEVAALTWGDIDLPTGFVTVRLGKGRKYRRSVIGEAAHAVLLEYRNTLPPAKPSDPLWVSVRNGRRLTYTGIREVLARLAKASGVHVTPHTLRRTFATMALRNGMSILHLQKLLGHASPDMVQRYAQMVDDDLQTAHAKYGPLSHL